MRRFLYDMEFKDSTIDSRPNFKEWKHSWATRDMTRFSPKQGNDDDCGVFTILLIYLISRGVQLQRTTDNQQSVTERKLRLMIAFSLIKCNEWPAPAGRLTTLLLVSAAAQQPRPDTKSGRSLSLGLLLGKAKYKKDTMDCSGHLLARLSLLITGSRQLSPSQILS